ncbi:hypothetical protein KJ632_03370 [Patescibacteria group bacterium]|nr:hypothetical protein [Patescibacteria group bacterium]
MNSFTKRLILSAALGFPCVERVEAEEIDKNSDVKKILGEELVKIQNMFSVALQKTCNFDLGPVVLENRAEETKWGSVLSVTVPVPQVDDKKYECISDVIQEIQWGSELPYVFNTHLRTGDDGLLYPYDLESSRLEIQIFESKERAVWERLFEQMENSKPESVSISYKDIGRGKRSKMIVLTKGRKKVHILVEVPKEPVNAFTVAQGVRITLVEAEKVAGIMNLEKESVLGAFEMGLLELERETK